MNAPLTTHSLASAVVADTTVQAELRMLAKMPHFLFLLKDDVHFTYNTCTHVHISCSFEVIFSFSSSLTPDSMPMTGAEELASKLGWLPDSEISFIVRPYSAGDSVAVILFDDVLWRIELWQFCWWIIHLESDWEWVLACLWWGVKNIWEHLFESICRVYLEMTLWQPGTSSGHPGLTMMVITGD